MRILYLFSYSWSCFAKWAIAFSLERSRFCSLSRNSSVEKAKSHFEVVKRFTDTFAYDELFPDVSWNKIAPEKRQLHTKCLAASTYLTIGESYIKSNSPICARIAFNLAHSQLNECLRAEPENKLFQQMLQKTEDLQVSIKTGQQTICQPVWS